MNEEIRQMNENDWLEIYWSIRFKVMDISILYLCICTKTSARNEFLW